MNIMMAFQKIVRKYVFCLKRSVGGKGLIENSITFNISYIETFLNKGLMGSFWTYGSCMDPKKSFVTQMTVW